MEALPDAAEFSILDSTSREQSKTQWTPKHSFESAVGLIDPLIRQALEKELNGAFREVIPYRPSPSIRETLRPEKSDEPDTTLDPELYADEEGDDA